MAGVAIGMIVRFCKPGEGIEEFPDGNLVEVEAIGISGVQCRDPQDPPRNRCEFGIHVDLVLARGHACGIGRLFRDSPLP